MMKLKIILNFYTATAINKYANNLYFIYFTIFFLKNNPITPVHALEMYRNIFYLFI